MFCSSAPCRNFIFCGSIGTKAGKEDSDVAMTFSRSIKTLPKERKEKVVKRRRKMPPKLENKL